MNNQQNNSQRNQPQREGRLCLTLELGQRIFIIPYSATSVNDVDVMELSDNYPYSKGVSLTFSGRACHYVRERVVEQYRGIEEYFRLANWRDKK